MTQVMKDIVTWLQQWFYTKDDIYTKNEVDDSLQDMIDIIYPIGAIYISTNSTSPQDMWGGQWERIKDTFLLASGDVYSNGSTGGEATHTLTIDEMPSHTHKTNMRHLQNSASTNYYSSSWTNQKAIEVGIDNTGGDQPHNNMPPYLAVYVWKRTG